MGKKRVEEISDDEVAEMLEKLRAESQAEEAATREAMRQTDREFQMGPSGRTHTASTKKRTASDTELAAFMERPGAATMTPRAAEPTFPSTPHASKRR